MDPTLELQGAIVQRLRSYAPLTALIGNRVYDEVPTDDNGAVSAARFPYVSIGPTSAFSDDADCIFADNITFQIDAWSIDVGMPEVRRIAHAIRQAFRGFDIVLAQNALVLFEHDRTDYIRDGDIKHASIRFTAVIETP